MRFAILLGRGAYPDERLGAARETGPRKDFLRLADLLDADILSYRAAAHRRGRWFERLFARAPAWGSAVDAALRIRRYDRWFVSGEDVGLRLATLLKPFGVRGKLICLVHHMSPAGMRQLRRIGHRAFGGFVIVSRAQHALLLASGVPEAKIHYRHDAADDLFYAPAASPEPPAERYVVACGSENRDYGTLLRAAPAIGCEIRIFGSGFWGAAEPSAAGAEGGQVRMMERVSFPELRRHMQGAVAIVVPLNDVDYAAGVNGLMEGLAVGRPVIVTRSRGIVEYLEPIAPELTVRAADDQGLAAAINSVLVDPDRYRDDGARNRIWLVEHCALDDYAREIAAMMRAL